MATNPMHQFEVYRIGPEINLGSINLSYTNASFFMTISALTILFELLEKEGLSLGTSTGINVAGAIKLAKDLGPNHTIVTILCDKSDIYRSKMFNKKFLTEKSLPYPKWL